VARPNQIAGPVNSIRGLFLTHTVMGSRPRTRPTLLVLTGRLAVLLAIAVALALTAAAAARAGTIVADSGFRATPNGFSFQNYGDAEGYAGLNAVDMQLIFGDGVCVVGKGAKCVLTPGARYWMNDMNGSMAGGHCYGMAMLASITQRQQLPRFGISSIAALGGGPNAFDLEIKDNRALQRAIARAFSMQGVSSVIRGTVRGTPKQILEKLKQELTSSNPATWQFGIFQWGMQGGHAITPYAVEDMGGGIYDVHVYDNNWPGDDDRRLTIDTNKDTWKYFAATNPSETGSWYIGNAKSGTLRLMPNQPAFGTQECPVCVGRQGLKSKYNQISLSGMPGETAHVVITDPKGRKLGVIGGKLVNQIPGARAYPRTSGPVATATGELSNLDDTIDPVYELPRGLKLKIKVDGRKLTDEVKQSLTVVGPTFDSTAERIRLGPGQVAHATLNPKRQTLSFTARRRAAFPKVSFGAESRSAAYSVRVATPGAPAGTTVFFAKKPRYGMLRIAPKSKRRQAFRVIVNRLDANGEAEFSRSYSIRGRQQAYLYYGPLARKNGVARIVIGVPGKEAQAKILKLRRTG